MATNELPRVSIDLLNRYFGDDLFASFRTSVGFQPTDLIVRPKLGDYLAALGAASGGAGLGGAGFSSFIAPTPPMAAIDAITDEFNTDYLDSKWTRIHTVSTGTFGRGVGTYTSPSSSGRESFTARPGWYLFQAADDDGAGAAGIHGDLGSANEDDAIYYTRFSVDNGNSTNGTAVSFALTATTSDAPNFDDSVGITLLRTSTDNSWTLFSFKNVSGSATTLYTTTVTSLTQPVDGFAISVNWNEGAPTYTFWGAQDHGGWKFLGSFTDSGPMTLDRIVFYNANSDSGPNPIVGVDYIRREAGTLVTK